MTCEHIAVVLNGEYPHAEEQLKLLDSCDHIIAADGGINWLHAHGRNADTLVGDLDSASPEAIESHESRGGRVLRFSPEKDETDAELALELAVSLSPSQITILGATGGRVDHLLANILLLCMDAICGHKVAIYDGSSFMSLIRDEARIDGTPGDTLSLLPLGGNAEGISTTGLYYPLHDEPLRLGPARGVSNVLTSTHATIRLRQGLLLAVHTPTKSKED